MTQVAVMLLPLQSGKESQLANFTPTALFLGASRIRTRKKAYNTMDFIRLGLNFNYNVNAF